MTSAEDVDYSTVRLKEPMDEEGAAAFKEELQRKIDEVVQADHDGKDIFAEYILVMLNNLKSATEVHDQLLTLLPPESAAALAEWVANFMIVYEAEDGAADYEESAMEQEGHEGAPHDEDTTIIEDMQVDATGRADPSAGTAAARLLKTALQQSIKSTSEAPKAVPKPLKTVQGPPPEFKPRKETNMGYSRGPIVRRRRGIIEIPARAARTRGGDVRVIDTPVVFTVTGVCADEERLKAVLLGRNHHNHAAPNAHWGGHPQGYGGMGRGGRGGYGPMIRGRGVYAGSYRNTPYLKAPQAPVFGRPVDPSQTQGASPGVSQKSAGFRGSTTPFVTARGRGRNMQYIAPHLLESHQQPAPQAQGGNTAPAFRTQHKVWVRPGAVAPAQQVGASSAATAAV